MWCKLHTQTPVRHTITTTQKSVQNNLKTRINVKNTIVKPRSKVPMNPSTQVYYNGRSTKVWYKGLVQKSSTKVYYKGLLQRSSTKVQYKALLQKSST